LLAALHLLLFFLFELLVFDGLQCFGDAGRAQPAGAEAADVEFALLDYVFVLGQGGEERGLVVCATMVVVMVVVLAVVRGWVSLGGVVWG
jgi:hypothetical protein